MNLAFTISMLGVLIGTLIVLTTGALLLQCLAGIGRAIVRSLRSSDAVDPSEANIDGLGAGILKAMGVVLLMFCVLAAGYFVTARHDNVRGPRPVAVSTNTDMATSESARDKAFTSQQLHQTVRELEGIRDSIRTNVREARGRIHVEPESVAAEVHAVLAERAAAAKEEAEAIASVSVSDSDQIARENSGESPRVMRSRLAAQLADILRKRTAQLSAERSDETNSDPTSDVIIFEITPETVAALLGEPEGEMLRSLSRNLPETIRQTYALIPLTAPANPVSAADRSLKAAEMIHSVATALIASVEKPQTAPNAELVGNQPAVALAKSSGESQVSPLEPPAVPLPEAEKAATEVDSVPTAVVIQQPAEAPEPGPAPQAGPAPEPGPAPLTAEEIPLWLTNPDGGRVIVETPFRPAGEDNAEAIRLAVNEALLTRLKDRPDHTLSRVRDWERLIQVSLAPAAIETCVVATYDRKEVIPTREGPQAMYQTLALVEFSEEVDHAAQLAIRQSVQENRINAVGTTAGFVWLAVLTGGLLIRFGRRGGRVRKLLTVPVFALIPIPLVVTAVVMTVAMSQGATFEFPWQERSVPVVIGEHH